MSIVDEVLAAATEMSESLTAGALEDRAVELIFKIAIRNGAAKPPVIRDLAAVHEAMRMKVRSTDCNSFDAAGLRGACNIVYAVLLTMDPSLMGDIHDRLYGSDAA